MLTLLHRHHISFKSAFSGLIWSLRTQPNFRIHIFLATVAVLAGLYFQVSHVEMVLLVFVIVLGLVAEMINTAIESMTDLITREWRQEAKIAKDVAAGMMLTVAIGATVVAAMIFWPYIMKV